MSQNINLFYLFNNLKMYNNIFSSQTIQKQAAVSIWFMGGSVKTHGIEKDQYRLSQESRQGKV